MPDESRPAAGPASAEAPQDGAGGRERLLFTLEGSEPGQRYSLRPGAPLCVGRALTSDIPVVHPTISRRHAELLARHDRVEVRDLGSSNGTFLNGTRVTAAEARAGDTLTFGTCAFTLAAAPPTERRSATPPAGDAVPRRRIGDQMIRFARPVEAAPRAEPDTIARPRAEATLELPAAPATAPVGRLALKLSLLLDVSKALSGTLDLSLLLQRVVDFAFQLLEVDRAALLLLEDGELVPRVSREARVEPVAGDVADPTAAPPGPAARPVPRSIAEHVVRERIAVLTDDAPADERFGSESVVLQQVQSALCVPLLGHEGVVLGVLYVDSRSAAHRFDETDLDFLVAFGGIAAVALENTALAERLRREAVVRSSMARFFNPALAARIAADPHAVRLGGERRRVAVLFADIRSFTPLAESMPPETLAELLNEYFSRMVECVFAHGGTLDKFIGDALLAQWGAPIARADDADAALRAARDMLRALDALNAEWARSGRPPLGVGIGLNVGDAFAGHIGSEQRLEYTVIGDVVNVAARLCGHAAAGEILLTADAAAALTAPAALTPAEPLVLKGKREAVPVLRLER